MNAVPPKAAPFAALLSGTPFARALESNAQVLIIEARPPRLVHASAAARELLGATSMEKLDSIVVSGDGPGARRMRELALLLTPGAPPRMERLRFYVGPMATILTFVCASYAGPDGAVYLVASSPDFFKAESREPRPAEPTAIDEEPKPPGRMAARRFVWSVDEQLTFAEIPEALSAVLADHAPRAGETVVALGARIGLDDALARVLRGRATFSALSLEWPRSGAAPLRISFSGAPVLDRDRSFRGFRGFGIIAEHDEAPAPGASAAPETPALVAPPQSDAIPDEAAPASAEQTSPAAADDHALDNPAPEQPSSDRAPESRGAEIVALRAYPDAANVVPIRPGALRPMEPRRPETVELTSDERNTFREIARALGAKVRDDDPADDPPASTESNDAGDLDESEAAEASATPMPTAPVLAASIPGTALGANAAALLDRLPIGVLVTRDDKTLHVNRALLDLLGYDDVDHFIAASGLSRMFEGRHPDAMGLPEPGGAFALTGADGEAIDVEGRLQSVPWDGAPATLISCRRATGPEAAERIRSLEVESNARQGQTSELSAILDTAADGVVLFDADGKILSLNRSGQALFGLDQKDVVGESFLTLLAPDSRHEAKAFLDRLKSEGAASLIHDGMEAIGRERNGGDIPLFISFGLAGDRFCAVLRDATQWKTTEHALEDARKQAERANAQKSEFLARISHEIRTPLNAILGFAEVIVEERFGPIGNDRYKDYLKDIHASGSHVMSLVNDLLDLSKIEAGKLELAFEPIDANRLIQECVSLMQPQAARERIIMRLSLFEHLPKVIADERSLRQIMLNLMSNAVKFNEPGGQVIVSTALNEQAQAVLRVRDTGIGMSEDEIETAMQPFRQIATARPRSGSGLGLPLTKALVEANRAGFSIRSGKQQGTLIELAFPTVQVAAQ
jgi:PAS domain S-box-containing protein